MERKRCFALTLYLVMISIFLFSQNNQISVSSFNIFRRAKDVSEGEALTRVLEIMGGGIEKAPSFQEGLMLFRTAEGMKLNVQEIKNLRKLILGDFLQGGYLREAEISALDAEVFLQHALNYALGIRRD
ncbi:MAG: hypothetical protein AB7E08_04085 [Candidatus Omnitrophota bacterium]